MQHKPNILVRTAFEEDVYRGLSEFPKHLSSQFFYDERGDRLFQEIMRMPEYYLTAAEYHILETHKEEIIRLFTSGKPELNVIELGAGDGTKTKVLLRQMASENRCFRYTPVDISQNALDTLEATLLAELPGIAIMPLQGTYFEVLSQIPSLPGSRKAILFLGSNIGNLPHGRAVIFLQKLRAQMKEDDLLFVGFDQKKNPATILAAYNDSRGITEAFNKNILKRINREMEADFDLDKFLHWEVYDPESGTARSYLVSREKQRVQIKQLNLHIAFEAWETIHTEISQKYTDQVVNWLAGQAGLQTLAVFTDPKGWYKNHVFRLANP